MSSLAWGIVVTPQVGRWAAPGWQGGRRGQFGTGGDDTIPAGAGMVTGASGAERRLSPGLSHMDFALAVLPIYRIPEAVLRLHS